MVYLFEKYELDEEAFSLTQNGQRIPLEPKALRVLLLLVAGQGKLIERSFLLAEVWKDTFVEEVTLTRIVGLLRKQLGDDPKQPRFIETVPTLGFRFIAPVSIKTQLAPAPTIGQTSIPDVASSGQRTAWLRWIFPALLLLTAASAIAAYSILHWRHTSSNPRISQSSSISLAILPVSNETGDANKAALLDGFTEDLIRQVSEVPRLAVISRTSVARYKGQSVDVRVVGQALHASFVMTSSVRPLENKLVATVELSHADTGAVAFSREYVINRSDFRPAKADIANDVVRALGLDPETAESHKGTSSAVAYSSFLEGMGAVQSGAPADLHRGISSFEEAVRLDPEFSLAWADMAETHTLLGIYFEAPTQQMPIARQEAQKALELDPTLASAHGTLGLISLLYDWNVSAANSQLAAAGSQESAFSVLSCSAHLLHEAGKSSRAEDLVRRMEADNPQSAVVISELGCIAYYRGDYQEAIDHYHEALKLDAHSPVPYWGLGKSLSQQGKFREAVEAVSAFKEQNGFEPPLLTAEAGYALGRQHKIADANERISVLRSESIKNFVDPYLIAVIYLGLGQRNETFDWLAKALDAKSPFLISILTDPKWESLRADPRFLNILSQMHIT